MSKLEKITKPTENLEGNKNKEFEVQEVIPNQGFDYKPIINLPLIEIKSLEEEEKELIKLRARLYRYECNSCNNEWKERGTGDVKLFKHKLKSSVRLLMRRDHTLKICANHYITSNMELKQHLSNDKAFIWSTVADFANEVSSKELLCIRFGSRENANKFKEAFENAKLIVQNLQAKEKNDDETLVNKLNQVSREEKDEKKSYNFQNQEMMLKK